MEEDKLGCRGVPNNNGNLNEDMNLFVFGISDFHLDDIVPKLAEPASNSARFVIKLEFSGDINWFECVGRLATSDIDFDVQLIVLVVGEQVLFFRF